jgi:hypothetical protein
MAEDLDTSKIRNWRSIITLIVFVITSKCEQGLKLLSIVANSHRVVSVA